MDLTNNVCIVFVCGGGYVAAGFVYGPVNDFSFEVVQVLDKASDLSFKSLRFKQLHIFSA